MNRRAGYNGNLTDGDVRQLSREAGVRRENAEDLRKDLVQQGVDVKDLDQLIKQLREMEDARKFSDVQGLEALQNQVIEGLKTFEFGLYRKLGLGDAKGPALGARSPVPAEYRAQVDEYYRSLAAPKKKK